MGQEKGKMEENTNCKNNRVVMLAMDGSPHSEYALKWYAKNLYRKTDEVYITHCAEQVEMPPPTLMEPKDTLMQQLAQTRQEKNRATFDYLEGLANQHNIRHKIEQLHGHPGLSIVKAAEEKNAGMIICGSRGQGFIRRTIIGSISDYILHHARMPVIICKNEEEQEKLKQWFLF